MSSAYALPLDQQIKEPTIWQSPIIVVIEIEVVQEFLEILQETQIQPNHWCCQY